MKQSNFFAMISRMKYINRWGLMRNTRQESLSEHSMETAMIAHALAMIGKERFGKEICPEKVATLALFHDSSEILTGDMPTPIKYHNQELKQAYKAVEQQANLRLLALLPEDLRQAYEPVLLQQEEDRDLWALVRGADKISALIKCMEEEKVNNREFTKAAELIRQQIEALQLPEADCFMEEFLPGYRLALDELQ